jgi:hypothetical protein
MQRTNAARRAATFCRAASGHIDRKKSNKLQAASNKLQAGGWVPKRQAATFRTLNQDLAVVIWYRAARELVSTIQYQSCEACLWGEAGSSSQTKGERYDTNRQTKRHRRVLQRPRKDGHHQTPSGGEDMGAAHGHPERRARCALHRAAKRKNRTGSVRKVESFSARDRYNNQKIINSCPGSCIQGPRLADHDEQQATSSKRQAASERKKQ